MKVYLIAGEASGDLHGGNLARAMLKRQPQAQLRGWGGDHMTDAGVHISKHYRELAFMGFIEVVMNLRTIARNFKACKADILAFQPDVLVLIDYPGFNLRMAKWAHEQGIRVVYYISPQLWAWKAGRIKQVRAFVDQMLVILPFEKDWYNKRGVEVDFVGHPLLDAIDPNAPAPNLGIELDGRPIIAMLPGSRKQEIDRMLPVMLGAAERFPAYQFVVAGAPSKTVDDYVFDGQQVPVVFGKTYDLFRVATAGWVTSGTATLEAALHQMPQVVLYKGSPLSYAIARRLVKVKYISLVNLIMDREVVRELIQHDCTVERAASALQEILPEGNRKKALEKDMLELRKRLGGPGASDRAAELILDS